MDNSSSYKIYNASAGSGKTFSLVKNYLSLILASESPGNYRYILAITFTNKAVNEMKQRVIKNLAEFSEDSIINTPTILFESLQEELQLTAAELKNRAKKTLKHILHNYAFFEISTIDKFTNRVIRTFAKDLQLPQNFEVVLNTDLLLSEAIDNLLSKVGEEKQLTKTLLNFSLAKIDEDKSWDISFDLQEKGKLIFNENHSQHLEKIKNKTFDDFDALSTILSKKIKTYTEAMVTAAEKILALIQENGLDYTDFKSAWFPKFMLAIRKEAVGINFTAGWKINFDSTTHYNKSTPESNKSTIDGLMPSFSSLFSEIKSSFYELAFLKNFKKNITPLSVINAIQKEIKNIEIERDEIPLAYFNTIIANEIKNQPTPFIYERLGERYKHYFIDEFQDTSALQWNNLIPLIGNALEGNENASLMLVGDAKQAIYRWRGGKAEQFISLFNKTNNPFYIANETITLETNYRSCDEVISFNNAFFKYAANYLTNPTYKELFENGSWQQSNNNIGGYVSINFIEKETEDKNAAYCSAVLAAIKKAQQHGYAHKDICILTRGNKEGSILANYLTEQEIPIISSDSLLLNNYPNIKFLNNLLAFSINPLDEELKVKLLYHLFDKEHGFYEYAAEHLQDISKYLLTAFEFDIHFFLNTSLFDAISYAVKCFNLVKESDAYINYYLDEIYDFTNANSDSIIDFLVFWEKKKNNLSVVAPAASNAVQLMTIHKSKGLEFPIVIYPYANSAIKPNKSDSLWVNINKEEYHNFEEAQLSANKNLLELAPEISNTYAEEIEKQELDSYNVLYVALTRAVEQLYIISEVGKKESKTIGSTADLLKAYLTDNNLWEPAKFEYHFGLPSKKSKEEDLIINPSIPYYYTTKSSSKFNIVTKAGLLWESKQENAIEKGILVHHLLSKIQLHDDINQALEDTFKEGMITKDHIPLLKTQLLNVTSHPELQEYFTAQYEIYNERDILTQFGETLRPDRVVIKDNKAILIDYKTGDEKASYANQLNQYAQALFEMGYHIKHKIIVYIEKDIKLKYL